MKQGQNTGAREHGSAQRSVGGPHATGTQASHLVISAGHWRTMLYGSRVGRRGEVCMGSLGLGRGKCPGGGQQGLVWMACAASGERAKTTWCILGHYSESEEGSCQPRGAPWRRGFHISPGSRFIQGNCNLSLILKMKNIIQRTQFLGYFAKVFF